MLITFYDFYNLCTIQAKYPWGDGRHSPMFHPYYNFLKEGYETDKDGNKLPPGVYADE